MTLAWCVDCGRGFHRGADETWKARCIICFKKSKREGSGETLRPAFDSALAAELRDMLPRLRQLCHPDRHDGSLAATKASQWLNDLRERLH